MGQIDLLQEELQQVRRREELRTIEAVHAARYDARGVQPDAEQTEPLAEGWRAYWLGFMAGLGIAVIVPLWTGLKEQKIAADQMSDSARGKRMPAQVPAASTTGTEADRTRPDLGRKGNGLR